VIKGTAIMNTAITNTAITIPINEIIISAFGYTDAGRRQSWNEDSFLVANLTADSSKLSPYLSERSFGERGLLFVVADGMGGAVAGEVASATAVARLWEMLATMPDEGAVSEQLKRATETANRSIWELAQENPSLRGMGSTLTAALVKDGVAHLAQVGDSRAYLIRGERIHQLTRDQSLIQLLVDIGDVAPADALRHPKRQIILQTLGAQPKVRAELTMVELCRGDYLIICTDGLSNHVTPQEMRDLTVQSPTREIACWRLIDLANEHGSKDDMTVIVSRFDGQRLPASSGRAISASVRRIGRRRRGAPIGA
jgi:serine/threonine protein phosphatase PrpC